MSLTQERRERAFKEAQKYNEFLDAMQVNRDLITANYAAYHLGAEDLKFFAELPEPVEVLVLAHDWCSDVATNLPLFAKIEAETGKLHLHIIPRDPANWDIAEAYPDVDGSSHIPLYIFFNQRGDELGVFIERATEITALRRVWYEDFFDANPDMAGRGLPMAELPDTVGGQVAAYVKKRRSEAASVEQAATIAQIKPILNQVKVTAQV